MVMTLQNTAKNVKKSNGKSWRCGSGATKALKKLVAGTVVECDNRGKDDYRRIISVCAANGIDINEVMHGHFLSFLMTMNLSK